MRRMICILLAVIGIMLAGSSCASNMPNKEVPNTTAVDSGPRSTASKGSTFLTHMDDLKAINIAANFLKELGETVSFQETLIEYHEAQEAAVHIALAEGKTVEYSGDFLEIRFYSSDDPETNPCEKCTVVYISQDGKILGQNKIFQDDIIREDSQQAAEGTEEQQSN